MARKKQTSEQRQAASKRAKAMWADRKAAAQNKSVSVPTVMSSDDNKLDKLLSLVTGQTAKMDMLESRLDNVEGGTAHFRPMQAPERTTPDVSNTYQPPAELMKSGMRGLVRDGDTVTGSTNGIDSPSYIQSLPPNNRPIFQAGAQVRLNPDALIHGGGGRTWGEVLGTSSGVGQVKNVQYLDKRWEPKYTVVIPEVTRRSGSGFRESELLPA
jgi:hypothetical protein